MRTVRQNSCKLIPHLKETFLRSNLKRRAIIKKLSNQNNEGLFFSVLFTGDERKQILI